jgi:LAS superfamily LD-carboxypeptidase LdcB
MKEVGLKNVTEKMVLKRLDDNMGKWLKENAEQYGYVYTEGTV